MEFEIDHEDFTPYEAGILYHVHSGVAGIMAVHDEDLDTVARARKANGGRPIECEGCDAVYVYPGGWKH